jgi:protocatechuate 3,4-dioxygenase beta subunit
MFEDAWQVRSRFRNLLIPAGSQALFLGLFAVPALIASDVTLHGRVVDENDAPVSAARVKVRPAAAAGSWEAQTDPTGIFALTFPGPATSWSASRGKVTTR